jgi:outer membrane lipoprotein carrier protein
MPQFLLLAAMMMVAQLAVTTATSATIEASVRGSTTDAGGVRAIRRFSEKRRAKVSDGAVSAPDGGTKVADGGPRAADGRGRVDVEGARSVDAGTKAADGGLPESDRSATLADAGSRRGDAASPLPEGVSAPEMLADVKLLVERVQSFYEKTQDFTADFRQDYTYKTFKRTQTSSGTVTFKKPGLMRWEYLKPSPKTFVLAGERVYAFDPEAKLLTRASIATSQLSASVTFLWGRGQLAEEFSISKKACSGCTGVLLEMNPKRRDPRFKTVLLEIDEKSAQVLKSTVVDPDGSENAIAFLKLKTNTGVDEKLFKLAPPPGTQVQDFLPRSSSADGGS